MTALTQAEQLGLILALQRDLALEGNVDNVLLRIAGTATTLLAAERATVYVIDQGRREVWSRSRSESTEAVAAEEIRLPMDGLGLAAAVARGGGVVVADDPYADPRFDPSVDARTGFRTRSAVVVPIDARDGTRVGVLQVVNKVDGSFTASDRDLAGSLAFTAGIALEFVALQAELAAERLRVIRVGEETRHRLARDLHDGVAQTLANGAIGIEIAQKRARSDVPGALEELGVVRARLVEAQQGLRDILFALRPVALSEDGLGAAVRALAERMDGMNGSRVAARDLGATRRAGPEVEAAAFAVIRESANNAVKTGRAPHVWLDLVDAPEGIVARIEDDGTGFDVGATLAGYAARGSLGLLQMRESAHLAGGRLEIDSSPGHGTRVRLWIPA
ncbi:MAG TPA: GAF domain-containing sensor histidine kinase [Candidatus Saccharimonadales bacterium]|nr:GAF domain-containing sensor histidine kinase [Candidatus Saccharimonadales bacterium]